MLLSSYTWNTGNWSICTRTCGGGVQTRQVTCERHRRRGTPVTAKDSFCEDAEGNKPSGMSLCSPFRCPTLDEPVYAWSTGPWSECSSQCGYQTRHVVCHEIIPGLTTATSDDKCDASSKPPHQKQCDGQNCQAQGCIDRISICQFALRIELIRCSVPRQRNLCCVACKTHVSISARSNKKDNRQGQP
ncbi:A disintegrin and metalloproteinase with thrombospondin motifs 12-like [Corticium candelabrum]|uniref:A disintegrin and metalloproteinase with thrombospondin motifs 12-like n=1 Tax=Corticium candelabrum TaxID=121492 RepID=UPI002E2601D0|nr:A disintegrin and metalloproteinase with thrombospondin motifs 12-like [Corticium candelabrum]